MEQLRPCASKGIVDLLDRYEVDALGKHCVIVGESNTVGRPMAMEMLSKGATVSVCHKHTENLESHVKNADILISAVGKASLIPGAWVKEGSVVVDVGINRLADGKICGDVEFDSARTRASMITPVPGGVGPMTIYALLDNTVQAYKNRMGLN